MKINTKIKISSIINFIICLIIVDYVGPFASYKGSMVLISLLGMALIACFSINKNFIRRKNLVIWEILFIYLLLNSLLNLLSSLLYILVFAIGYIIIMRNENEMDFHFIFKFCQIISVIIAISIYIQAFLPNIFYSFAQRWFFYSNQYEQVTYLGQYCHQYSGIFYEVSFSAVILATGIIISFTNLIVGKRNCVLNVILIAGLYFAVILTGKRSFMLIIPVIIIAGYFMQNINKLNKNTLFISVVFIVLLVWKAPDIYVEVLKILAKNSTQGIQLSSREKFWALAFNMFKDSPICGMGLNSYDIYFNASGIRSIQYEFAGAHNAYIQLLAETGIVGLVLYLVALLNSIRRGIIYVLHNNYVEEKSLVKYMSISLGILIVFLIYGFSGNVLHQPQQLIAVLMCVSVIENILNR